MSRKPKSLALAYSLLAIFGLQGVHQFYLGNWKRGLAIAFLIHVPTFWFAYLMDQSGGVVEALPLAPLVLIWFGLVTGLGLVGYDLFTLKKQTASSTSLPGQ